MEPQCVAPFFPSYLLSSVSSAGEIAVLPGSGSRVIAPFSLPYVSALLRERYNAISGARSAKEAIYIVSLQVYIASM